MKVIEHSAAWWEGWDCKGPKTKNPYAIGQPWLSEHPDKRTLDRMKDWESGWECRFYGEEP